MIEEKNFYELLYKIRCRIERYDRMIGQKYHDICIHDTNLIGKALIIYLVSNNICCLITFQQFTRLLHDVCSLRIQEKSTEYCNEILSRELISTFKNYFCDNVNENTEVISADSLKYLVKNSLRYIEQCHANTNHFRELAHINFHKEEIRSVISADGFKVQYKVFGVKNKKNIILINAYGIPAEIWKYLIQYYSQEYKVIIWDIRGSLEEHCQVDLRPIVHSWDLEEIIKKENVEQADVICWCSGLKILAEFYHRNLQVAKSMVIISGYFNPISNQKSCWTEFDITIGKLSHMIVRDKNLAKNPIILALIQKLFQFEIGEKRLETLETDGGCEEERYLLQYALAKNALPEVKNLITVPFNQGQTLYNYAEMTVELQKHEILPLLTGIPNPVLIINAGMDQVTDARCAKFGHDCMKTSEVVELPNATHWSIWEDYDEIALIINKFWKEI